MLNACMQGFSSVPMINHLMRFFIFKLYLHYHDIIYINRTIEWFGRVLVQNVEVSDGSRNLKLYENKNFYANFKIVLTGENGTFLQLLISFKLK